jgi:hypothetical protein
MNINIQVRDSKIATDLVGKTCCRQNIFFEQTDGPMETTVQVSQGCDETALVQVGHTLEGCERFNTSKCLLFGLATVTCTAKAVLALEQVLSQRTGSRRWNVRPTNLFPLGDILEGVYYHDIASSIDADSIGLTRMVKHGRERIETKETGWLVGGCY